MAYVVIRKETVSYNDEDGSHSLLVELLQDGGSAGSQDLGVDLSGNDIVHTVGVQDADATEVILPSRVELQLRDTTGLLPIFNSAKENDLKLRLTEDGQEIFEGYVSLEANEVFFLDSAPVINLLAYDGLSILKDRLYDKTDYYLNSRITVKAFLEDVVAQIGIDKPFQVYTNYDDTDVANQFPIGYALKPSHLVRDMDEPTYWDAVQRFCNLFNWHLFQFQGRWRLVDYIDSVNKTITTINLDTGVTASANLSGGTFADDDIIADENSRPKLVNTQAAKEFVANVRTDTKEFLQNPSVRFDNGQLQWWNSSDVSRYDGQDYLVGQSTESGVEFDLLFLGSIEQEFRRLVSNDLTVRTILEVSFDLQIFTDEGDLNNEDDELYLKTLYIESSPSSVGTLRELEASRADGGSVDALLSGIRPNTEGYQYAKWSDAGSTTNKDFVIGIGNPDSGKTLPKLIKVRRTLRIVADSEDNPNFTERFWKIVFQPERLDTQTQSRVDNVVLSGIRVEAASDLPLGNEQRFYDNNTTDGGRILRRAYVLGSQTAKNKYFLISESVFQLGSNLRRNAKAWNIAKTAYYGKSYDTSSQVSTLQNAAFKPDGSKMYVGDAGTGTIYEYNLGTAWDVSSASYSGNSFSVGAQESNLRFVVFKPDGTKMYAGGDANDTVYEYDLSTAWDVSSASYSGNSFSVSSQETSLQFAVFKPDGTKIYAGGFNSNTIYEYDLNVAWQLGAGVSYSGNSFDVSSEESVLRFGAFKSNGTKMYSGGDGTGKIYEYDLSTVWDVSSATYSGNSFDFSVQAPNVNFGVFKPDGTKLYAGDGVTDTVFEYELALPFPEPTITDYRTLVGNRIQLAKFRSRYVALEPNVIQYFELNAGGVSYTGKVMYLTRRITRGYVDLELMSLTEGNDDYTRTDRYGETGKEIGYGGFSEEFGINNVISPF